MRRGEEKPMAKFVRERNVKPTFRSLWLRVADGLTWDPSMLSVSR